MKRINRHSTGIDQGSLTLFSDFEEGGAMWTGDGERSVRSDIVFSQAFCEPPSVQVSLSMWDFDQQTSPRADISAIGITATGFSILFKTWGDTRVARVRASWQAIGALSDENDWDVD